MTLIDIEKLEYEPFILEDGQTVDYISAEKLRNSPKINPVNHAEWLLRTRKLYSDPDEMFVEYNCSHCGTNDLRDTVHVKLWDMGYKDVYKPRRPLSNFCRGCGYKMDLRELYEQYKLDWCEARGYILDDIDESVGINGECYACFDEWYKNEYLEAWG